MVHLLDSYNRGEHLWVNSLAGESRELLKVAVTRRLLHGTARAVIYGKNYKGNWWKGEKKAEEGKVTFFKVGKSQIRKFLRYCKLQILMINTQIVNLHISTKYCLETCLETVLKVVYL
jgi:hypothetical protein